MFSMRHLVPPLLRRHDGFRISPVAERRTRNRFSIKNYMFFVVYSISYPYTITYIRIIN
jgi:hypothetical protein